MFNVGFVNAINQHLGDAPAPKEQTIRQLLGLDEDRVDWAAMLIADSPRKSDRRRM
jgi:hypothetical protein